MSRRSLVALGLALVAGGAFALTGCTNEESGSSSSGTTTAAVEVAKVDEIAAMLPQRIRDAGKLVIGVNVPYAPNEFKDGSGQIIGFDVDLMRAVSQVFGVEPVFTEADFDKIIPAIQAGTYDMGMSSFTDTKEREQTVDFTTYFSAGVQWAHRPDNPIDPNNACGKRVAVQATTIEDTEEVPAKSAACVQAGQPPIEIVKFDRQDDATTALVLGNVDAMSADSPVTAYAIKQSGGKIEATGEIYDAAPYGWPVVKGSELAPALQAAVQHLIDDGTYATITENWGVQAGMIEKSEINGAVN